MSTVIERSKRYRSSRQRPKSQMQAYYAAKQR